MADSPNWQPWERVRKDNGMWGVQAKPLEIHPVVHTLLENSVFLGRAKAWSWSKQGATNVPQDLTKFAPWISSPREGVAEYWHAVMTKFRAHRPDLVPTDEAISSLSGQTAIALDLSAINPLLNFD